MTSLVLHNYNLNAFFVPEYELFLHNEGYDCLKRVTEFPLFTLDTSFTPAQEKEVLMDLYFSTNGQQWYETSGWNGTTNNTFHCSWYGITCHNNTSYIKSIMLGYNNLDGSLPSNIWKIRNLFSLCIPGNPNLRGSLGDLIFGNTSNLLTVSFNAASITGHIPDDIIRLIKLQNFLGCDMNGDGFSGPLPEDIGNMTELRLLCLGGNNFIGEIPRSVSKLKRLFYLDLQNTPGMMHGNLTDLLSLPSMSWLLVSGVKLTGTMPRVLSKKIIVLVFQGNEIEGTLPQIIPKGKMLQVLNVANNQLTGDIPGDLLLSPNIGLIDVSQNKFSSINNGNPWPRNASATVKSYISLAGNRNLSIDFTSFFQLFTRVVDAHSSLSILNVSFCNIKSPLLTNLSYLGLLIHLRFSWQSFLWHDTLYKRRLVDPDVS